MRFFRPRVSRAPLNPDFIKYQNLLKQNQGQTLSMPDGYIPSPIKLTHLTGKKMFLKHRGMGLPASYNLEKEGRLTPVKNQGDAGTCWAFATYGSLESCLLPDESWDFSENNMKNLLSKDCPAGYDRSFNGGGNEWMATAYLSRWSGPVLEKDDPYNTKEVNCETFSPQKHITKVIFIPARNSSLDNTNLKLAIKNYGAVYTAMYFSNGYYNESTFGYYASGGLVPNHAVCLVGWDDKFPITRFNSSPPGDGAFIARNSWGTDWGNKGYFCISYYDIWIGVFNALFGKAKAPVAGEIIHQYDLLGWTASYGFGKSTAWFANIFTADKDQELTGYGFYNASPDSEYTVYVYKNITPSKPRSGEQIKKLEGKISEPSYCVRSFAKPIALKKGQSFSVVVKLTTPDWNWPVPAEVPVPGYSSKAKSKPGQGFISDNGSNWYDIYNEEANSSICLKAFAR